MAEDLVFVLTLLTALGCGLISGLFFAFSVSVMKALARLPPTEGMSAMQSINVVIINPLFLAVFLGTGAGCVLSIIVALVRWRPAGSLFLLAGGTLYLVGSLFVTARCNVPRNEVLARVDPADPASAGVWADYLLKWTAWNHVRAVASIVAAGAFALGLCF